jgi:hypothetical protein
MTCAVALGELRIFLESSDGPSHQLTKENHDNKKLKTDGPFFNSDIILILSMFYLLKF